MVQSFCIEYMHIDMYVIKHHNKFLQKALVQSFCIEYMHIDMYVFKHHNKFQSDMHPYIDVCDTMKPCSKFEKILS